jgi:hypothetical protein
MIKVAKSGKYVPISQNNVVGFKKIVSTKKKYDVKIV